MDGLFEKEEHSIQFTKDFLALYTNGPAAGGGISTGSKNENILEKELVAHEHVHWQISVAGNNIEQNLAHHDSNMPSVVPTETIFSSIKESTATESELRAAPAGQKIPLYEVAHSRVGDKGNDLKMIVTPKWVKDVMSPLLNPSSFPDADEIERRDKWVEEHVEVEIYEARGIQSLNVIVRNILDGGVNCSRRIDRHGKTISDVVLCQQVVLPP